MTEAKRHQGSAQLLWAAASHPSCAHPGEGSLCLDKGPGLVIILETLWDSWELGVALPSRDLGVKSGQRLELGVNALENFLELPNCPHYWAGVQADDFAAGVGCSLNKKGQIQGEISPIFPSPVATPSPDPEVVFHFHNSLPMAWLCPIVLRKCKCLVAAFGHLREHISGKSMWFSPYLDFSFLSGRQMEM